MLIRFKQIWQWENQRFRMLLICGLLLHILALAVALLRRSWLTDDSVQYLLISDSLFSGMVSQSFRGDWIPDMQRLPGYSLFLLLLGKVPAVVLFVQHFLVILTGGFLIRISALLGAGKHAVWAGVFFLFQPYTLWFACLFLNEILFIFCMVSGVFFLLSGIEAKEFSGRMVAGYFFLGLTVWIRPVGWVVVILLGMFHLYKAIRHQSRFSSLAFVLIPFILFSPWIIRNGLTFGDFGISTMSGMVTQHGRLGGMIASEKGEEWSDETLQLNADSLLATESGIQSIRIYPESGQNHELNRFSGKEKQALTNWLSAHPGSVFQFSGRVTFRLFSGMGKGWATLLTGSEWAGWISAFFQGLISLILLISVVSGIRKDPGILTLLLCYFGLLAAAFVAWADGRYRMVADPLLFPLVGLLFSKGLFFGKTRKGG